MGNRLGRRRRVVDERYTRPQGLYAHKDVDHKKLRKLILESKLAPCYPGEEELYNDHEECPICFLYYPSLNRSRCCTKGICTECFLQMKDPNSVHPTQCPFCKTANYAVEYRGAKTKEEKGLEQIEEQRVIEAKIRMRRQELQDEEERMQRRLESGASSSKIALAKVEHDSVTVQSSKSPVEREDLGRCSSRHVIRHPTHGRTNRDDEFDLDLEDIMIMEAIWLSVQENERLKNPMYENVGSSRHAVEGQCSSSQAVAPLAGATSSPSGRLACAIASLAQRQQMNGEPSGQQSQNISALCIRPGNGSFSSGLDVDVGTYPPEQRSGIVSQDCRMGLMRDDAESGTDSDSHVAVARTSYASSIVTEDSDDVSVLLPPPPPPPPLPSYTAAARTSYASSIITEDSDDISVLLPPPPPPLPPEFFGGSYLRISGETMPQIFEEQMMFFKAVPEARDDVEWASDATEARTSCASFVTVEDSSNISTSLQPPSPPPLGAGGSFTNASGTLAPEGFEEQMMLAMAVSLAQAHAGTIGPENMCNRF